MKRRITNGDLVDGLTLFLRQSIKDSILDQRLDLAIKYSSVHQTIEMLDYSTHSSTANDLSHTNIHIKNESNIRPDPAKTFCHHSHEIRGTVQSVFAGPDSLHIMEGRPLVLAGGNSQMERS